MVKKVSRMLSALMIVVCVFVLSACGGSSGSGGGSTSPVGVYEMTAASAEGDGNAAEQFELMKESGLSATLDLKDDGTGLLNMFGTPINVSWDKEARTIKVYDQELEYTFEGKVFTFVWENTKLEFTKTE